MVGVGPTCAGDTCAEPPLPTVTEQRTHFGLWSVLSSPLTISMDFRNESLVDSVWDILTNTAALDVNSAWAGAPGGQLAQSADSVVLEHCTPGWARDLNCTVPTWQVWWKPLPGGSAALFVTNNALVGNASVRIVLSALPSLACATTSCDVLDVWSQAPAGQASGSFSVDALAPHDSAFVVLSTPKGRDSAAPTPVTFSVDTTAVVHTVSPRYVSAGVDWHTNAEEVPAWNQSSAMVIDLENQDFKALAAAFAPAHLRIGGSEGDCIVYEVSGGDCAAYPMEPNTFCYNNSEGSGFAGAFCLSMQRFDALVDFAVAAGWSVAFGLNAMLGRGGNASQPMDTRNVRALLQRVHDKNSSAAFAHLLDFGKVSANTYHLANCLIRHLTITPTAHLIITPIRVRQ